MLSCLLASLCVTFYCWNKSIDYYAIGGLGALPNLYGLGADGVKNFEVCSRVCLTFLVFCSILGEELGVGHGSTNVL